METIINYLDNMFINLPQTPEVLRAKDDLAEMMEDKYNELITEGKMQNEAIGIVISEFGNIQELIDELGIAETAREKNWSKDDDHIEKFTGSDFMKTDHTKTDDKKTDAANSDFIKEEYNDRKSDTSNLRHVSDLEAEEYLFAMKQAAGKLASGVFLCICSPILLIILGGFSEYISSVTESVAAGVGITVLLCMVACAVVLFILSGMKTEAYEYLKTDCFILNAEYEQFLRNMRESRKKNYTFKIIAGIVLCIVSVIPVILSSMIIGENSKNEFPMILCVAVLLFVVGLGVFLLINAGMEEESYKVILQEKEFSIRKKTGKKMADMIAAVYWSGMTIAYLVWSFTSGSWGITWIIWPIAGILFDIISKMIESAEPEK